jgi:hypothetical protein
MLFALQVISHHKVTMGYSGSSGAKHIKGSYKYFSGTKIKGISAKQGETIIFSFSSEAKKGELTLQVIDSLNNPVAQFETNTSGTREINSDRKQKYRLVIKGTSTEGSFSISWEIR